MSTPYHTPVVPEPNEISCPACSGTGYDTEHFFDDGSPAHCEICNGYGTISHARIIGTIRLFALVEHRCPLEPLNPETHLHTITLTTEEINAIRDTLRL